MKTKKIITALLLTMIIVVSACLFGACNKDIDDNTDTPVVLYQIPTSMALSIDIYDNGTSLMTINNDLISKVDQEIVTIGSDNYVAYSLKNLFTAANIQAPDAITGFDSLATDYYTSFVNTNSFDNAYITIGKEIDNNGTKTFEIDSKAPRFIADKTLSKTFVNSKVNKIYVNPTLMFKVFGMDDASFSFGAETTLARIQASTDYVEFTYNATTKAGQVTTKYKGISLEKFFAMNPLSRNLVTTDATTIKASDNSDPEKVYSVESNFASKSSLYLAFAEYNEDTQSYDNLSNAPYYVDSTSTFENTVQKCKNVDKIELN